MNRPSVYLSGPITGCSYTDAVQWREHVTSQLAAWGIHCYDPMRHNDRVFSVDETHFEKGIASAEALYARDLLDVDRCTCLIVYLKGATIISIGTMFEMAWAAKVNKPVILVMEDKGNIHDHPFVTQAATKRVDTLDEAIELAKQVLL